MTGFAEQCMAGYLDGWTAPDFVNPGS